MQYSLYSTEHGTYKQDGNAEHQPGYAEKGNLLHFLLLPSNTNPWSWRRHRASSQCTATGLRFSSTMNSTKACFHFHLATIGHKTQRMCYTVVHLWCRCQPRWWRSSRGHSWPPWGKSARRRRVWRGRSRQSAARRRPAGGKAINQPPASQAVQ